MLLVKKVYATGGGMREAAQAGYGVAPGYRNTYGKRANRRQGVRQTMSYNRAGNRRAEQLRGRNPRG
jgi:hypothetical protein